MRANRQKTKKNISNTIVCEQETRNKPKVGSGHLYSPYIGALGHNYDQWLAKEYEEKQK